MKWLRGYSPGWDARPSQVTPQHFAGSYLMLGGERQCKSKVSCPRTQHNDPGQVLYPDWLNPESSTLTIWPLRLSQLCRSLWCTPHSRTSIQLFPSPLLSSSTLSWVCPAFSALLVSKLHNIFTFFNNLRWHWITWVLHSTDIYFFVC